MRVDRLIVLYRAGGATAEAKQSAEALGARFRAQLAQRLVDKEFAGSKLDRELDKHCHLIGVSSLSDAKQRGQAVKTGNKALRTNAKGLGKLWGQESRDEAPRTWGAYVLIHGSSGISSFGTPDTLAALIAGIGASHKNWRLKKVCLVACTLGAAPYSIGGDAEPFVKSVCTELKVPGALIGGYTVPVFVGLPEHPAKRFDELRNPDNVGHKMVSPTKPDAEYPYDVEDVVVRLTDHNRATYKVAWRWDDDTRQAVQVDVMNEWYHQ
jgi:hypothetical protein